MAARIVILSRNGLTYLRFSTLIVPIFDKLAMDAANLEKVAQQQVRQDVVNHLVFSRCPVFPFLVLDQLVGAIFKEVRLAIIVMHKCVGKLIIIIFEELVCKRPAAPMHEALKHDAVLLSSSPILIPSSLMTLSGITFASQYMLELGVIYQVTKQ